MSSTAVDLHQNFTITFGDNSTVQGDILIDTVNLAGLTALGQTVVAATNYSADFAIANIESNSRGRCS